MASKFLSTFNEWKPVIVLLIGGGIGLLGTGWGAAWYVSNIVQTVETGRQSLQEEVAEVQSGLDALAGAITDIRVEALEDRYTLTAASERALRTAIENPGMRVPDPRDPNTIIVVRQKSP